MQWLRGMAMLDAMALTHMLAALAYQFHRSTMVPQSPFGKKVWSRSRAPQLGDVVLVTDGWAAEKAKRIGVLEKIDREPEPEWWKKEGRGDWVGDKIYTLRHFDDSSTNWTNCMLKAIPIDTEGKGLDWGGV